MMYLVEVANKKGKKDIHGEHIRHDIVGLGIARPPQVSYTVLYRFEGQLNLKELNTIAKELLIDPVTQNCMIHGFYENIHVPPKKSTAEYHVEVWYKPGVTDTVAESVTKAIGDLGIKKELKIQTGHKYNIRGCSNQKMVEQITQRLLANTMIQQYTIQ